MDRRQYLRSAASIGFLTAVAGCLGTLEGTNEAPDAASGSDTEAATDRTGERALARSVGRLNDAALALDVGDDLEDPAAVAFDPEEPRDLLASAREFLETAEAELDADRQPDVDELRAYADVLAALVDVAAVVTDETLADDVDDVAAALADRRLEEASAVVDDLVERFARADDRFETASTDLASLDADRLSELSVVDLAEVESGASVLGDVLASMVTLVSSLESTVEGYECLERGEEHADDGAYERARDSFADARSSFATATADLEDDVDDAPAGLTPYYETGLCQNGHLERAADYFVEAAEAAMDNDPLTARQRREDAEAELAAADDCAEDR